MIHQGKEGKGCTRLFEMTRNHEGHITPHSHRFAFDCIVLEGNVKNTLYRKARIDSSDMYVATTMKYNGEAGQYEKQPNPETFCFTRQEYNYTKGERYGMRSDDIHSIVFEKGSKILFIEGPTETDSNIILEPFHNKLHIPTFEVKDWMFKQG